MNTNTYKILSTIRRLEKNEAKLGEAFDRLYQFHNCNDTRLESLDAQFDIAGLTAVRNSLNIKLKNLENK